MGQQRSDRLQVVLEMEQRKEDATRKQLQAALEKYQDEQTKLQELQNYHADYQAQIRTEQKTPVSSQRLIGWQQFIAQLNRAIEQQQIQLNRLEGRVDEARKLWRGAWEKRQAMARHIDECRVQERQEADRREQKSVDEAANLRFARLDHRR